MNRLAGLDPGDSALEVAALSLAIVALASIGSEALARGFRRLEAKERHDLYLGGLLVALLSPMIVLGVARSGLVLYRWPIAVEPATVATAAVPLEMPGARATSPPPFEDEGPIEVASTVVDEAGPVASAPRGPIAARAIPLEPLEVPRSSDGRRPWAGAMVAVWGLGLGWLLARLARGAGSLFALRRRSRPIVGGVPGAVLDEVRRSLQTSTLPPILEAGGIPGPLAGGVFRPLVVLPIGMAETLGASGLRDVLIHECAHVLRRDPLVGWLQRVAGAVFWPHPLVHRLNGRLARAREEACDDLVLRLGDPCGYARTLLMLAERVGLSRSLGAVVGLFETRWRLADRVAGILDRGAGPTREAGRWWKLTSVSVLALAGVAVAAIGPGEPTRVEPEVSAIAPFDPGAGSVIEGQVVDEAGAPVAGASVNVTWFRKAKEGARTGNDGRFRLEIPGPIRPAELVMASINDGARMGIALREEPRHARFEPIRIVLKPSRAAVARVVDAAGRAVEGASVEVQGSEGGPIGGATTDPAGIARLQLPEDAEVDTVIALKDGVGFDYFENYRSWPSSSRAPLPAELRLVLDGATSASLRAVDSAGRPIAGVSVHPSMIARPGKLAEFNASGGDIVKATTGDDGIARFNWLPKSLGGEVGVMVAPWSHQAPDSTVLKPGELVTARVLRHVKLAGKVTNPDGSPARGVIIQAESRGKSTLYGRRLARTGDDGSYSVTMPPDQVAMIAVVDPDLAARALTGIEVREDRPLDGLDLHLVEGARFVARISDAGGKPVPRAQLTILHRGVEIPEAFRGNNSVDGRQDLVTWAKADLNGRVELRLGPGDYTILGHENLHVDGPGEFVREYQEDGAEPAARAAPLTGLVLAAGRPVAGASVRFVTLPKRPRRDLKAVADDRGRFAVEPLVVEGGLVLAQGPDGRVAGYRVVQKAGEELEVAVVPASVVSGRVVELGGRPIVGRRVQLITEIPVDPSTTFKTFDSAPTDAEGRYRFAGLVPGTRCQVTVPHSDGRAGSGRVSVEKFAVNGPDPIALPDVEIPGEAAAIPPAAAAGPKFAAGEVEGGNTMPYAITRKDVEALVEAIGREPATPEVIAQVGRVVRPQEGWVTELDPIRKSATDPRFVALADRASQAVLGRPATSAALAYLAHMHRSGDTEATLRYQLATWPLMKPGRPVRGVVEDSSTGQPVAGAVVFNAVGMTTTDPTGAFTLAGSVRRDLWVEAEGYALAEVLNSGDSVKVALAPERPIVGRVLERDGLKPVEGAVVWAMANHSLFLPGKGEGKKDHYGFPLTAKTDARGRFAFRGMPEGVELDWFEVHHPRFHFARNGLKSLNADRTMVLLVDPGCVVSGEILDELGQKVEGASVGLRPSGDSMARHSLTTEVDGRYHFANLAPGRYDLIVEPERQAFKTIPVFAAPARPALNQVVVEAGWTITGKVVDAAGRPLADAVVGWPILLDASGAANEANSMSRWAYTDLDGTFELAGLAPGKYRLTATAHSSGGQAKVDARAGQADLVITLPGTGR